MGFKALDGLLPPGGLQRGAIHEVLGEEGTGWFFAALIARSIFNSKRNGAIVWSDPQQELYGPAIAAIAPLDGLYLLQVGNHADELWATNECLRCRGVSAVIASPRRLSRIEARRLQLAAEQGDGIGILLRSLNEITGPYAAATRWLVKPALGDELVQRWEVQLLHGHGGQIGKSVLLEIDRDTLDPNFVRAVVPMVHRPDQAQVARASA